MNNSNIAYTKLVSCCKSKVYGVVTIGKLMKQRTIYQMSNGYFCMLRGCVLQVEQYTDTAGKKYWKPVRCESIYSDSDIVGKHLIVTLNPPTCEVPDIIHSQKGFMEIWRDKSTIKEVMDLSTCIVYSVYNTRTLNNLVSK